ncbi:redoxin domain-containing protein [Ornithinibacillus sp. L9]|uniref:Redoxin domain-containing protein n=1 Tax=Ornithinibacillus caprae TaxID=2678566 RepID=A0A6N8FNS7_9BACI|nr:redoxin domain-containing protein [Ornithinibacillus caprae]MUK90164.1 redoxin domain-containing protein [Ornithinibacillus caprae]
MIGEIIIFKKIPQIAGFLLLFGLIVILVLNINDTPKTENRTESDKASNFKLSTLDGYEIELNEFKGKGIMINFWASWCGPCKREMPLIQKVYNEYKEQDFEILAVNVGESKEAINNFLNDNPLLNFPILLEDESISNEYKVYYLPTTYFINADGDIVEHYVGELNEDQLHRFIESILP